MESQSAWHIEKSFGYTVLANMNSAIKKTWAQNEMIEGVI